MAGCLWRQQLAEIKALDNKHIFVGYDSLHVEVGKNIDPCQEVSLGVPVEAISMTTGST